MTTVTRRAAAGWLGALAMTGVAQAQSGGDYPSRPVTLVVPFPAGGGTDNTLRVVARHFQEITGQPMVIENRPGGETMIGLSYLKHQKPDGYTLGVMTRAQHVVYGREGSKALVNPFDDLTYVAGTHGSIFALVVRGDSPFNTVDDLVQYAKRNPGKASFGNIGAGTAHNIIALELARAAGLDVIHAAFKGETESNTLVMGGHLDAGVSSGVFIPLAQAGKLKVLGLALDKRLPDYPMWKTLKEQGYDVVLSTSVGIGGPKGLPDAVVQKLDAVIRQMAADPKFQAALMNVYQPVQYVPTAEYRKLQVTMAAKEQALVRQYNLGR